ncbi:MAG TPA: glycosyltransferase [Terriglobales bacterium]|nr:glycosyltransferase [Terriglobales bacterium]
MKLTIFGLTLSSSWGNGHATPYRAILRALHRLGHETSFYEKDTEYYSKRRDFVNCDYCNLVVYSCWDEIRNAALADAADSDVVIVGSYCPEGARISDETLQLVGPMHVFYDLDTPITLKNLASADVDYLRRDQVPAFDLYLSFTGGEVLHELEQVWGARCARALYGCVDPDVYVRVPARPEFTCDLSYMGTYAPDRQEKLDELFLSPAREMVDGRFVLAGTLYPREWQWPRNVVRYDHVAPHDHPALYSSSRATLNITRGGMARTGYCPSGRFFEAAACGTPIISDWWHGLDSFFSNDEIFLAQDARDVLNVLRSRDEDLEAYAKRARARTLDEHTGEQRAWQLLQHIEGARHINTEAEVNS